MDWLPLPIDFAKNLAELKAEEDLNDQHELLRKMVTCRLSYLETIQVDNVVKKISWECQAHQLSAVKVAIVGSSTFEHLLPGLRIAGLRRGLRLKLFTGSFGQYRQELFLPSAALKEFAPDFILISTSGTELLADIPVNSSTEAVDQQCSNFVGDLRTLWRSAREHFDAQVIQQSILDTATSLLGSYDRYVPGAPSSMINQGNSLLSKAAAQEKVLWLDVGMHAAGAGTNYWFDAARWYQGKMEIAPNAAMDYGELVARIIGAQLGKSRKCLVLDLDNTLWGGVIGDDGLEGIVLGQGSALGEAHVAIQAYAKSLSELGVILAVCSKNDESIATQVFEKHPEMLLSLSDIAVFVANWQDKAENLVSIARSLNIGLDALVFVDDNPFERSRVRESLPSVAVPELPEDPAGFIPCIANAGFFDAVSFTPDDQVRARQYRENAERDELRDQASTMADFLSGLNMETSFNQVDHISLVRATQLINKTNQFNATTQRMTESEVERIVAEPESIVYQFRLSDRFGDNGLVSVVLLRPAEDCANTLEIINWVMSCRVFGRQFEDEIMNVIVEIARNRGVRWLRGLYMPTDRNGIISDLYRALGFNSGGDSDRGSTTWRLDVPKYETRRTFIKQVAL